MDMYTLTVDAMEKSLDRTKAVILKALVKEKLLDKKIAAKWCETHTIILRKKIKFTDIIRKIIRKEPKEPGDDDLKMIVVKSV